MKWVPCARCGLSDLAVRDDFDEAEEMAVCDRCWAELDREFGEVSS